MTAASSRRAERAFIFARDRADAIDLVDARILARDRPDASVLVRDLVRARADVRALAHVLVGGLVVAFAFDRDRHDVCLYAGVLGRDLADALYDARVLVRAFARDRASRKQRWARRVAPWAAGLVAAATRLLPSADRARYAEEYLSELWDLAQSGAGRLRQLGYAFRQLRSSLSVGFALRSPRRRGAAP